MFEEMVREFEIMPLTMLLYCHKKIRKILDDRNTMNPTFYVECDKEAHKME